MSTLVKIFYSLHTIEFHVCHVILMTALNRVPDACDQGQLEGPYVHSEPGVEDLGALDALELVVEALVVVDLGGDSME